MVAHVLGEERDGLGTEQRQAPDGRFAPPEHVSERQTCLLGSLRGIRARRRRPAQPQEDALDEDGPTVPGVSARPERAESTSFIFSGRSSVSRCSAFSATGASASR
jgi:hypothetical protein